MNLWAKIPEALSLLNTKAISAAGVTLATASGATLIGEMTNHDFVLQLLLALIHRTNGATVVSQLVAPFIGLTIGLLGAYFGRPVTVPGSTPLILPSEKSV